MPSKLLILKIAYNFILIMSKISSLFILFYSIKINPFSSGFKDYIHEFVF